MSVPATNIHGAKVIDRPFLSLVSWPPTPSQPMFSTHTRFQSDGVLS